MFDEMFDKFAKFYDMDQKRKSQNVALENERRYLELQLARQDTTQNENAQPVTADQLAEMLGGKSALGISNQTALLIALALGVVLIIK